MSAEALGTGIVLDAARYLEQTNLGHLRFREEEKVVGES